VEQLGQVESGYIEQLLPKHHLSEVIPPFLRKGGPQRKIPSIAELWDVDDNYPPLLNMES